MSNTTPTDATINGTLVHEGDHVTIEYNSAYSENRQHITGTVTGISSTGTLTVDDDEEHDNGEPRIYHVRERIISRDDGYTDRRISDTMGADTEVTVNSSPDMGNPDEPVTMYNEDTVNAAAVGDEIPTLIELTAVDDEVRINNRKKTLTVVKSHLIKNGTREMCLEGNGTTYWLTVSDGEATLRWPDSKETVEYYRVENRNAWNITAYENLLTEEVEGAPWNHEWGRFVSTLDADEAADARRALAAMVEDFRARFDLENEWFNECYRDHLALLHKFEKWADEDGIEVFGREHGILGAAQDYSRESPEVREIFERLEAEDDTEDDTEDEEPELVTDGGWTLSPVTPADMTDDALSKGDVIRCIYAPKDSPTDRKKLRCMVAANPLIGKREEGANVLLTASSGAHYQLITTKDGTGTLYKHPQGPDARSFFNPDNQVSAHNDAYLAKASHVPAASADTYGFPSLDTEPAEPDETDETDNGEPESTKLDPDDEVAIVSARDRTDPLTLKRLSDDDGAERYRLNATQILGSTSVTHHLRLDRQSIKRMAELAGFEVSDR